MKEIQNIVDTLNSSNDSILFSVCDIITDINNKKSDDIDEADVKKIIEGLSFFIFAVARQFYDLKIYRGRNANDVFFFGNIDELSYRKKKEGTQGRVNFENSSLLYGSLAHETVFGEIRLKRNDYVNIITCKAKRTINMIIIGDIDCYRRTSKVYFHSDEVAQRYDQILSKLRQKIQYACYLVDAFFADRFSRIGKSEYKITNYIANEFLSEKQIDGIVYPSTVLKDHFNVAIKPGVFDEAFDITEFTCQNITNSFGYGIYTSAIMGKADSYEKDGTINWNKFADDELLKNAQEESKKTRYSIF